MEQKINPTDVNGWGIDADPENEPTYPIKNWTGDDHKRLDYEREPQQPVTVEVYHSNERPGLTRVFGTSVPPSGFSGKMRKHAFKYSENHYGHWLTLMAADRVQVIEAFIADIKRGYIPNILAERGFGADWKYDRKKTIVKLAVVTLSLTLLLLALKKKKKLSRG
ncbi:MAG: hypothetical protein EOP49_08840 [Sphingobacteriales bacterium]|nr:MAG: hypothetical protein EOP49_08840 [Sphingobacteriales bacterium]